MLLQLAVAKAEVEKRLLQATDFRPIALDDEETRVIAHLHVLKEQDRNAKAALNQALDAIEPLREAAEKRLSQLADEFRSIFSNVVKRCLGEEGSVEVQIRKNSGERAEYAVYAPVLNGTVRSHANMVSKSQAVLLDYAFRMTVLLLYRQLTNQPTFFVLETSEGVLDAAYVPRIGGLLGDFALDSGHRLILVNNLSRADFLSSFFRRVPDSLDRLNCTLNFLSFGRLSAVQLEGRELYQNVGRQIFGDAFSAVQ